jgi:thiol-disulfide isomerase/thioredoxin
MQRSGKTARAALALLTLGCSREAAPGPEVKEPERPAVVQEEPSVRVSAPPPPAASPPAPPAPPPFLLTELAPTQGALTPLLVAQVERARTKGLVPVVEFYADWCAPCRAFQRHLEDPLIKEALRGAYLVKLNMDDWHDKLPGTGFDVHTIPSFYMVSANGRPTGKMLDGDKWGRVATPAIMSASLAKFLGHE